MSDSDSDSSSIFDLSLLQPPSPSSAVGDPGAQAPGAQEPPTGEGRSAPLGEAEPPHDSAFPLEAPALNGLTLAEAAQLGAADPIFFNQLWFPKTFRQPPALYHPEIYSLLDNPSNRYINIQVCRDGAKTTILRAYSAKRIAYGLSRTILYVAVNETKAIQSVGWLKHQIETNRAFCSAFGLRRGKPWTDNHICIEHLSLERDENGEPVPVKIHIIAFGMTGGVRGVNLEDWRPDLIIIDDVMDDENSATTEQREKIKRRVFGAIKESLSPRSETPDAKMVLLNTPQDFEDLSEDAKKDLQFVSASYGCWTRETMYLDVEEQESSWPARYPSEELRAEKKAAIARNRYSDFAREKECLLVTAEDCAFRPEWLKFFGVNEKEPEPPHHEMWVVISVDPVPPPTKKQLEVGLKDKDYEVWSAVGKWCGKYYLLEQRRNRGHDPGWSIVTFFELALKWHPMFVVVETVAYQKTLEWILKQAMVKARRFWAVEELDDKREKHKRIVDGLHGPAHEGVLFVRRHQTAFISQFTHWPGKNPDEQKDDDLESAAMGVGRLNRGFVANRASATDVESEEAEYKALVFGGAP